MSEATKNSSLGFPLRWLWYIAAKFVFLGVITLITLRYYGFI
jgi:hypothetical protein